VRGEYNHGRSFPLSQRGVRRGMGRIKEVGRKKGRVQRGAQDGRMKLEEK